MKGFFELQTPKDLFGKLGRDLTRIQADPQNADCSFDFFITAYHILDWLQPDSPKRRIIRDGSVLLQVCDHLANGAKHFELTNKRHASVVQTEQHHGAFSRAFSKDFDISYLRIHLDGEAASELGESIDALDLALKVYDYWRTELAV